MYKHNFVKVGMVVPKIKLGDAYSNALEIVKIIEKDELNAILVFPETNSISVPSKVCLYEYLGIHTQ